MKAAGLDDLKPVVIQHIGDEALARITIFFKRLMLSSFIPNESSLHPQAGKGRLLGAEGLQTDNLIKLSPKGDEESPKLVPQWKGVCSPNAQPAGLHKGAGGRDGALVFRRPYEKSLSLREKIPPR